jgi:hypothetical protein
MRQAPANLKGGRAARWTSPAATIYLSIVLEFENGRGIGCHWKIGTVAGLQLPVPAPAWQDREFHVVVRSGTAEVGARLSEDYSPYIGLAPTHILRSCWQRCEDEPASRD